MLVRPTRDLWSAYDRHTRQQYLRPYQYPEKIAPFFITEAIDDRPLPVYGDGMQVRDWLYVDDHADAIDLVLHRGEPGQVYNVGGDSERHNIDLTRMILRLLASLTR